jgi:hypothetical protein
LGQSTPLIQHKLLISRARFLRDFIQRSMLKQQTFTSSLKMLLEYIRENLHEFERLQIDSQEWFIDRVFEVRGLIQAYCNHATRLEEIWMVD